jgi:Na+-driven multidrug efflux pump
VLLFLASFMLERQMGIRLAVAGGCVSMIGVILLIRNTFDVFASWSYAWALVFPTSVGLAMLVYGSLRGMGDQVKSGLNMSLVGAVLFLLGGFIFELIIGGDGFHIGLAWNLWPVILIISGILLLISNLFLCGNRS